MAFPTTPILDDFNTTGGQALTARTGWGSSAFGSTRASYSTDATPTLATSGALAGNYWNTTSADCESYFTVKAWADGSDTMKCCARITAIAIPTFYAIELGFNIAGDFQIVKYVAGGRTAIGVLQSVSVVNGDGIGISVIGTTITSYYRSGAGSWVQKDSATDATISGAGQIAGVQHDFSFTNSIDDFGGGVPVVTVDGAPARDTHTAIPFTQGAGGGALGGGGPH